MGNFLSRIEEPTKRPRNPLFLARSRSSHTDEGSGPLGVAPLVAGRRTHKLLAATIGFTAGARPMAVPGSWNEQYEDILNYLGLAWYVKRTYVPRHWRGERVFIRVGSANYFGTVYVNGTKAGSHEGGHLPFGFEITELSVADARFWSDKDSYLYDLSVEMESDRYTLRVGIRTVEVRGKEILLNGEPVHLNGYGRHEDFFASGRGLNLPLLVKDYGLMRWTPGCTATLP